MRRAAVIMTAHNTARYIVAAISSVRDSIAGVAPDWQVELRVGVDACPETAAALDAIGEPYWWSPVNVGTFVLRNSLVALAPADAYATFDSDDVMLSGYLPRVLAALAPGVHMAGAARYEVQEDLSHRTPPTVKAWCARDGSCLFTQQAWVTLGGYWDGHRAGMDTELMDRARKAGLTWAAVDEPLFLRRCNPTSLTQGPFTRRGTPLRTAAVAALAARKPDASVIHVVPTTTPLELRRPAGRVAVLVTAYRTPLAWLRECLASIQVSATRLPAHVSCDVRLGVDGCADTAAALDADGTPYYWSAENVGTYRLRNSLAAVAPADAYIVFDADDVMLPPHLPVLVEALRTHPIVGPSRYDVDGRLKGRHLMKYVSGVCGLTHDAWTRLGGYRDERYSADTDLIARAELAGIPVRIERDPLYLRRKHPESLTNAMPTGYHSPARKAAQARLAQARAQGWQNTPVIVPLVRRQAAVEQAS